MSELTPQMFVNVAHQQRIKLKPSFRKGLLGRNRPTWAFEAVTEIGSEWPEVLAEKLASKPLALPEDMLVETPVVSLANLVNGSVEPASNPGLTSFEASSGPHLDACTYAEKRFLVTISALGYMASESKLPPSYGRRGEGGIRVFTSDEQPLILQKSYGEKSGLTLTELVVGGRRVLPGSIVGLRFVDDETRSLGKRMY